MGIQKRENSGWSSGLNTQLTSIQIITEEKKNVKKPEQFSHSSAKKEDERFGRNVLAHLNLTFNSLNVLLDLAKGAALSHGAAGSLIRTLPSLLQR